MSTGPAARGRRRAGSRVLLAALPFLVIGTAIAAGWIVEGRVVALSDGDTVTILDAAKVQHKVRIAGIDAPEKGQPFGTASKESLSRMVFNRQVAARCYKKDRYGREVCRVYQGFADVGLEQVRAGMPWHFKEYQHEQTTQERLSTGTRKRARSQRGADCGRMRSGCHRGSGGTIGAPGDRGVSGGYFGNTGWGLGCVAVWKEQDRLRRRGAVRQGGKCSLG